MSVKKNKSIGEQLTHFYIKKIKKWMYCPACDGQMVITKNSTLWKCNKCGYSLVTSEFEDDYVFWFCDKCNAYLNNQEGFDRHLQHWVCEKCGFDNNITDDNVVGFCIDCGILLPDVNKSLCKECKTKRLERAQVALEIAADALKNLADAVAPTETTVSTEKSGTYFDNLDEYEIKEDGDMDSFDPSKEGSDYPTCTCGDKMTEFDGVFWYTCPSCGNSVRTNDDGSLTWQSEIFGSSSNTNAGECINCGYSLQGGSYTLPWEDGNNEYGYVICPHCRCKNEEY